MLYTTVYCASSNDLDPAFHESALAVGRAVAERGWGLVYGGGSVGLMGEVARACKGAGGTVVGVITEYLMSREMGWDGCDELIVVDTMRERKRLMEERGDGFVILPGGIGTYEEFFEIIVGRKLKEHAKPVGVVNAHGYYNPLVAMIEHGIEHRFMGPEVYDLFRVSPDVDDVVAWMADHGISEAV